MHLTEQKITTLSGHSDGVGVGAPGTEIEVTPQMIHAGAAVLGDYDPRYDSMAKTARAIFQAMQQSAASLPPERR
jgi:hypothetical protein